MKTFKEETRDRGIEMSFSASNNDATYICTSAYMHDLYANFVEKFGRVPSSQWYHKHALFYEVSK